MKNKTIERRNKILFLIFNCLCNAGLILFIGITSINLIKTFVTHYESLIFYTFVISLIFFKLILTEYYNKMSELDIIFCEINNKDKSMFNLILRIFIDSLNLIISLIIALFLLDIAIILLSFYVSNKLYLIFFLVILIMNVLKIILPDVVKFNNTVWIIIDKLIESKFGKKIEIKLNKFIEGKCKKYYEEKWNLKK